MASGFELGGRIPVETWALEAGHEDLGVIARDDDVRLERLESAFDDLAA